MDNRPNPDALLAAINRESGAGQRGRLKVFLGMAPGVGKTYAMLSDGRARDAEGIDVVVGYVETHGRSETEALLPGMLIAPRKKVEHRGIILEEMDIDAILLLRPQVVLVDELAHTNAPGSRHPKRYQDVLELLDQGIDVSTTLNVQHVESRADAVRQVTGATVQETVPDSVLERADEVELIDISPARLRERLASGKVYLGARADAAAKNFFKEDHLTALREIALRLTAERVDQQLRGIRQGQASGKSLASGDRVMVAVGASPFSLRLVRRARRIAYSLGAPWIAVSVDSGIVLSAEAQRQLDKNLSLARELGAEVIFTRDRNVARALIRVAQENNVSRIVAGKPLDHPLTELLRGGSMVDHLIWLSGPIDVYVVTADAPMARRGFFRSLRTNAVIPKSQYFLALVSIIALTAVSWLLVPITGYRTIALFYLLLVIVHGLLFSRGPVLLAATLSGLLWDYLFIPPIFTFYIGTFEDLLMFLIFFVVALVTGQLTSIIRTQERDERKREQRAQALYRLTKSIAAATSADELLTKASAEIDEIFGLETAFVLARTKFVLQPEAHHASTFKPDEKEMGVATWAYQNRHNAGRFTDTLPSAEAFHIPLLTAEHVLGVMAVRTSNSSELLHLDLRDMLESFARQIAIGLEKEQLRHQAEAGRVLEKSDQLHKTLFNSVSHELRTPLSIIQAGLERLASEADRHGVTSNEKPLLVEMDRALDRLNRLVKNLLDSARLESGQLEPKREWGEVMDLIDSAVELVRPALGDNQLKMELPAKLPFIRADFGLLSQALGNLIHNAIVHTPDRTKIVLRVEQHDSSLSILVIDSGPGFPPELLPRLFTKFHRASDNHPGGVGLGLSIAKGFVEAHGGKLHAQNSADGGAILTIELPLETQPSHIS